jgi:serine/threonine protein kinase
LISLLLLLITAHRGRFGVIRECRENATGKVYMAKIVPFSPESKAVALREYEILKVLHNERVMGLHEAYVTPRYLVLVAEYCTGKELLYTLIDKWALSLAVSVYLSVSLCVSLSPL